MFNIPVLIETARMPARTRTIRSMSTQVENKTFTKSFKELFDRAQNTQSTELEN